MVQAEVRKEARRQRLQSPRGVQVASFELFCVSAMLEKLQSPQGVQTVVEHKNLHSYCTILRGKMQIFRSPEKGGSDAEYKAERGNRAGGDEA